MVENTTKSNGRTLTLAALAQAKRLPAAFLRELGLSDLRAGGVSIPYFDIAGEEIAIKRRTALKAKDGSYWPKGKALAAYGLNRLDRAHKAGFLVFVEGESDCWALWHHNLPALGIPGANAAGCLPAEAVECLDKLYVHREPDQGGQRFVEGVAARLRTLGYQGRAFVFSCPNSVKDPADLHVQDAERFRARIEEALQTADPLDLTPQRNAARQQPPAVKMKVRELERSRPFPVEALPVAVADFVHQGSLALNCDAAYLALPALGLAAGLIGYTRVVRLKRSWRVPAVVWTLVVADSGSLKTPAFRVVTDYLFKLQKRLDIEHKRELAQYADAKEKWNVAAAAARRGEGEAPGDEPQPPVRKTAFTSDATIEAVAELIGENPRGLLVACDELAAWLGSFTRYKGKAGGTDLPRWLSMHSAGGFAYHRKTWDRRRIVVPHAAVSVAGGVQPGIVARLLTGEFTEAGLAGRLLMAMPPRPAKEWSETEIDPDTERRYHELLEALFHLEFQGEEPHVLNLAPEAKAVWIAFYNHWAKEQAAVEGELAAAYSKLEEAAARFALIHHVVSRVSRGENDLGPVEKASVEAGIKLCLWFASEARRIYAALAESDEERQTCRLVEFIRSRGGTITIKELQRSNSRKYMDANSAAAALESLAAAELGAWVDRPADSRGGRPTRDFVLHPTTDDTDETTFDDGDRNDSVPLGAPDETLAPTDETPKIPAENRVSSVSSVVGQSAEPDEDRPAVRREVSSDGKGVSSGADTGRKRRRGTL